MSGLRGDRYTQMCLCVHSVAMFFLFRYIKKIYPHKDRLYTVVGKGKSILSFSDNCKYSSGILYQTLQMIHSCSCSVLSNYFNKLYVLYYIKSHWYLFHFDESFTHSVFLNLIYWSLGI